MLMESKKICFTITYDLDNKYYEFLIDQNEIDLSQLRIVFSLFLKEKYSFVIFNDNLTHISICSDKIEKGYDSIKLEQDIKEIKKYLKAYKSIIKGALKYDMSYMSAKCFVELSNQKKEFDTKLDNQKKEYQKEINDLRQIEAKFLKLCEKLGIDPDSL